MDDHAARPQREKRAHLTLLAETTEGYHNLIRLVSSGFLDGYWYKPRVDLDQLAAHCRRRDRAVRLPVRARLQGAGGRRPGRRPRAARPAGADLWPRRRLRRDPGRRNRRADPDPALAGGDGEGRRPAHGRNRRRPLPDPRRRDPARGAALHPDAGQARQPRSLPLLQPRVLSEVPAGDVRADGRALRRGHAAPHGRDRGPLQRRGRPGRDAPAALRGARGPDRRRLPARPGRDRTARALPAGDTRAARPARVRAEDDRGDGLPRLLPDRVGLHPLRPRGRRLGRPGTRLRRGLAGRLLSAHYRPRSDGLLAAVRAVPEPRPQEHARHRHRLRGGRPRARHQLRGREVRPPQRRPDHHLRQDAAQGRDQGCGTRDGHRLRRGRPHRQAGARGPEGVVRGVHEAGRRAAQGLRRGRHRPLDRGHGAAAGGCRPQRLDPCRRGRDRRPAADRVPAAAAEGRRGRGRDPVPDGRRRGAGPAEDGLPGAAQPGRDRPRGGADRADHRAAAVDARPAAGRRPHLRDAGQGRRDRACSSSSRAACARRCARCGPPASRT